MDYLGQYWTHSFMSAMIHSPSGMHRTAVWKVNWATSSNEFGSSSLMKNMQGPQSAVIFIFIISFFKAWLVRYLWAEAQKFSTKRSVGEDAYIEWCVWNFPTNTGNVGSNFCKRVPLTKRVIRLAIVNGKLLWGRFSENWSIDWGFPYSEWFQLPPKDVPRCLRKCFYRWLVME